MVIGIAGKIGSGKDLAGIYLQHILGLVHTHTVEEWENEIPAFRDEISEWEIRKFADPVKDTICILLNCTREQIEDRDFKNKELPKEWWIGDYRPTLRNLLQKLGTDAGRNIIHPDIWITSVFNHYTDDDNWIITDVRFRNEVEKIEEVGGIVIKVETDTPSTETHISERDLDWWQFDYIIKNDSDKEELYKKLFNLVNEIKIQK